MTLKMFLRGTWPISTHI